METEAETDGKERLTHKDHYCLSTHKPLFLKVTIYSQMPHNRTAHSCLVPLWCLIKVLKINLDEFIVQDNV